MAQSLVPKTQAVSAAMAHYSMLDCPPLSSFRLLPTNGEPFLLLA
jgi:hypothetical protein